MPSVAAPYQRTLYNGIPYWKETATGNLYYYESATMPTPDTRICLGTEATGLSTDWQTLLASKLEAYRTSMTSRARAPAAAP